MVLYGYEKTNHELKDKFAKRADALGMTIISLPQQKRSTYTLLLDCGETRFLAAIRGIREQNPHPRVFIEAAGIARAEACEYFAQPILVTDYEFPPQWPESMADLLKVRLVSFSEGNFTLADIMGRQAA